MRRKISFIIGALLLTGVLAVALRNLPAPVYRAVAGVLPEAALTWIESRGADTAVAEPLPVDGSKIHYVIGPQKNGVQEIRIWAIRNGTNYGWIQLPKGTPVHLLREENSYVVVRYDESILKIHRSVAEQGLVVPVTRDGRVASL